MVDGINSAKSVQQKQAEHPIKKQESGPQKGGSIFNYVDRVAIEGPISGFDSVQYDGTVEHEYEDQGENNAAGQTIGKPDVDLDRTKEIAKGGLEGSISGFATGSVPYFTNGIIEGMVEYPIELGINGQPIGKDGLEGAKDE